MRLRHLTTILLAAGMMGIMTTDTAEAATPSKYGIIIGDSISVQSGPVFKAEYHPSFDLDAQNGRDLGTITAHVEARLAAAPAPRVMVLALASNDTAAFTRQQYVDTFDLIPSSTRVVMVTPYRDPAVFPEQQDRLAEISGWMKDLDRYRPNGVISSWRWTMLNESGAVARYISADGVHPTAEGREKWAALLNKAISTSL